MMTKNNGLAKKLAAMALAVTMCCTMSAPLASASNLICGQEEHTHTEECYIYEQKELDCHVAPHTHTSDCYGENGSLVCGQVDFVLHTHDEQCYDGGTLVCTLPEHEEEAGVHIHNGACYDETGALACGMVEVTRHQHNDGCFDTKRIKDDVPLCGMVEHVHHAGCYAADGSTDTEEPGSSLGEVNDSPSADIAPDDTGVGNPVEDTTPDETGDGATGDEVPDVTGDSPVGDELPDVAGDNPIEELPPDEAGEQGSDIGIVEEPAVTTPAEELTPTPVVEGEPMNNSVDLQIGTSSTSFLNIAADRRSLVFDTTSDLRKSHFSDEIAMMLYVTIDEVGAEPGELQIHIPEYFTGITEHYNSKYGLDVDGLKTWLADYTAYNFLRIVDEGKGVCVTNTDRVASMHLSIPLTLQFNTFDLADGVTYDYEVLVGIRGSEAKNSIQMTARSGITGDLRYQTKQYTGYPSGNTNQRLLTYTENLNKNYGVSREIFEQYKNNGYVFVEYEADGFVYSTQRYADVRLEVHAMNDGVILGHHNVFQYHVYGGNGTSTMYVDAENQMVDGHSETSVKVDGSGFSIRNRMDPNMENGRRVELYDYVLAAFPEASVHVGEMLESSIEMRVVAHTVDGKEANVSDIATYRELFDIEEAKGKIYALSVAPYYFASIYCDWTNMLDRLAAGQDFTLDNLMSVGMVRNQSRGSFNMESPTAYTAELVEDQFYLGNYELGSATRLTGEDYHIVGASFGVYDALSELNDVGAPATEVPNVPDYLKDVDITISVQTSDNPGVWVEDMVLPLSKLWVFNKRALQLPVDDKNYATKISGYILFDNNGMVKGNKYYKFNHSNVIAYKMTYPHSVGYTMLMSAPDVTLHGSGSAIQNSIQSMLNMGETKMPITCWFNLACQDQIGNQICSTSRDSIYGATASLAREHDDVYAGGYGFDTTNNNYPFRVHWSDNTHFATQIAGAAHTSYFYNQNGAVCDPTTGLASAISFEVSAPVILGNKGYDYEVPDISDLAETYAKTPDYNIMACRDVAFYALLPEGVSLASVGKSQQPNSNKYNGYWAAASFNENINSSTKNANTTYSNADFTYDVETFDNYKGSNRQFVKVVVHYNEMPVGWYAVAKVSAGRHETAKDGIISHAIKALAPCIRINTVADFGFISKLDANFIMAAQYLKVDGTPYVLDTGCGLTASKKSPLYADNGSYAGTYAECFADLNGDGNTADQTVVSSESTVVLQKLGMVSTTQVTVASESSSMFANSATGKEGQPYRYRLGYSVFGVESQHVVLFDSLEEGQSAQGTLVSVDLAGAKAAGLHPVLYYNEKNISSEAYVSRAVTANDLAAGFDGWQRADTSTLPADKVKSIAISFDGDVFSDEPGHASGVYVYVNMCAPESFADFKTEIKNNCFYTDQLSFEVAPKSVMGNTVTIDFAYGVDGKLNKLVRPTWAGGASFSYEWMKGWTTTSATDGHSMAVKKSGSTLADLPYYYGLGTSLTPADGTALSELLIYDDIEMGSDSRYSGVLHNVAWHNIKPVIYVETGGLCDGGDAVPNEELPGLMQSLTSGYVYRIDTTNSQHVIDCEGFHDVLRVYAYYDTFPNSKTYNPALYLNMTHGSSDGASLEQTVNNEYKALYKVKGSDKVQELTSNQTTITAEYDNWRLILPSTGGHGLWICIVPGAICVQMAYLFMYCKKKREAE